MTTLDFSLHPAQLEVFHDPARFKVVSAGRRGGKTYFAMVMLLLKALETGDRNGKSLDLADVWYVAPTYGQAASILWRPLKAMAAPVTKRVYEKDLSLELINGRRISLKGSDREDTLRGVGLGYLVMDEVADQRAHVFEEILMPTLADYSAEALFIGTPKGKNHFYDWWMNGENGKPGWANFKFTTYDNPFIPRAEIGQAKVTMSDAAFRQEILADFAANKGALFKEDWIEIIDPKEVHKNGFIVTAMDPAGFSSIASGKEAKRLDEHAIATVSVGPKGWDILNIAHGRWGVQEAALKLLKEYQVHRPMAVGIEKGALKNALEPYILDYERSTNIFLPEIVPLTHGGQRKVDRITWALQGRFEHRKVRLVKGPWNRAFIDQLLDFPNPLVHDDLVDAVAYIDQLGQVDYTSPDSWEEDYWQPLDDLTGI